MGKIRNLKELQREYDIPLSPLIKELIYHYIMSEHSDMNALLPTEEEFAEHFGVSRMTVRRALVQLVHEGIIARKRGLGTKTIPGFWAGEARELTPHLGEWMEYLSRGKTVKVEVEKVRAPEKVRARLQIRAGDFVTLIRRVRYTKIREYVPLVYVKNYLPLHFGKKFSMKELRNEPMLYLFPKKLGISFFESYQSIQATLADGEVSQALNVPAGFPILFVERLMVSQERKPYNFAEIYYHGDRFKYTLRQHMVKRSSRKRS